MKNKISMSNIRNIYYALLAFTWVTIPQIITNLYSVPRIIVLKIQKDSSTKT